MATGNNIVISHHANDRKVALQIAGDLEQAGAQIWINIPEAELPIGAGWRINMPQGIMNSRVMLLILSPDSIADETIDDEWKTFLLQDKAVVPIFWRECEPSSLLNRLQYIEFRRDVIEYPRAFNHLLKELEKDVYGIGSLRPANPTLGPGSKVVRDILEQQRLGRAATTDPQPATPATRSTNRVAIGAMILLAGVVATVLLLIFGG